MNEIKLLGATLLHTRYGHWQHPKSKRFFIKSVPDNYRGYPGLFEELLAIRQRALKNEHTIHDQQRIQWIAQGEWGALSIYQESISIRSVSREDLIESVEMWLEAQDDVLVAELFATAPIGVT
jgi:hypothetical protein